MNIEIRNITALETYPVRQPVLRAGRPVEDCYFNGDHLETTLHLGAFMDNELVAVATFLKNKDATITALHNHKTQCCYQLRGMAVLKKMQGKNIGKHLLNHAVQLLRDNGATALWFQARVKALPFYEKLGYQIVSLPFEIEIIGTHYKMYQSL